MKSKTLIQYHSEPIKKCKTKANLEGTKKIIITNLPGPNNTVVYY